MNDKRHVDAEDSRTFEVCRSTAYFAFRVGTCIFLGGSGVGQADFLRLKLKNLRTRGIDNCLWA